MRLAAAKCSRASMLAGEQMDGGWSSLNTSDVHSRWPASSRHCTRLRLRVPMLALPLLKLPLPGSAGALCRRVAGFSASTHCSAPPAIRGDVAGAGGERALAAGEAGGEAADDVRVAPLQPGLLVAEDVASACSAAISSPAATTPASGLGARADADAGAASLLRRGSSGDRLFERIGELERIDELGFARRAAGPGPAAGPVPAAGAEEAAAGVGAAGGSTRGALISTADCTDAVFRGLAPFLKNCSGQ